MKTLKGFSDAVTKIRSSNQPLTLWWRPVLKGNAVNEVLALPTYHRRPSAGIKVGVFSAGFSTDSIRDRLMLAKLKYASALELSRRTRKQGADSRT